MTAERKLPPRPWSWRLMSGELMGSSNEACPQTCYVEDADGKLVCAVHGYPPEVTNVAELIARAAEMDRAINAIKARIDGEYDNPDLESFGPLGKIMLDIYRMAAPAARKIEASQHGSKT